MATASMPEPEQCTECGFDEDLWNRQDTIRTIRFLGPLARLWTDATDPQLAQRRPDPDTWSIAEYLGHIGDVASVTRDGMRFSLEAPGTDIGDAVDPGPIGDHQNVDMAAAFERIDSLTAELVTFLEGLDNDDWQKAIVVGGLSLDIWWAARHLVHDTWHHFTDIAAIRTQLGDTVTAQSGRLGQINRSSGGVPKLPVDGEVRIGPRGVGGDAQASRRHHGRPWQALCLWSTEVLAALAAEGHPITAGAAGENLTIEGLDWALLRPGAVVEIGDMVCRLTSDAQPCHKIGAGFIDGNFRRIEHGANPGWSRWYAEVLRPGSVQVGDPVTVGR